MKWSQIFSRYLEKQSGTSGNIFRQFSWYLYLVLTTAQVVKASLTVNKNSAIQDYVYPDDETQRTFEYFHNKVSFYEGIVQSFLILENNFTLFLMQQRLRTLL